MVIEACTFRKQCSLTTTHLISSRSPYLKEPLATCKEESRPSKTLQKFESSAVGLNPSHRLWARFLRLWRCWRVSNLCAWFVSHACARAHLQSGICTPISIVLWNKCLPLLLFLSVVLNLPFQPIPLRWIAHWVCYQWTSWGTLRCSDGRATNAVRLLLNSCLAVFRYPCQKSWLVSMRQELHLGSFWRGKQMRTFLNRLAFESQSHSQCDRQSLLSCLLQELPWLAYGAVEEQQVLHLAEVQWVAVPSLII